MDKVWCLIVDLELHWGLSINHFLATRSRPALRVIPPTTLIGALAYPIARLNRWPETIGEVSSADRIKDWFKGIYYSFLSGFFLVYAEISKIFSYKVREKQVISDAVALPKAYTSPGTFLRLYYLLDEKKIVRILLNWKPVILAAGWGILRIGARESLVSVRNVKLYEAKLVHSGEVETGATIPLESVKSIEGEYVVEEVADWRRTKIGKYFNAPRVRVAQPLTTVGGPGKVKVEVLDGFVYEVDGEFLVPWR